MFFCPIGGFRQAGHGIMVCKSDGLQSPFGGEVDQRRRRELSVAGVGMSMQVHHADKDTR